jgi:hypothetical protein
MNARSKAADLLKVIGQKTVRATPAKVKPATLEHRNRPRDERSRSSGPRKPKNNSFRAVSPPIRGKAIQFYLHAPDEKLIREFAVWLAPHRKRINDSLVIKTVLRVAKTGPEFLAAYDAAVKVDGRTVKRHPKDHENPA